MRTSATVDLRGSQNDILGASEAHGLPLCNIARPRQGMPRLLLLQLLLVGDTTLV